MSGHRKSDVEPGQLPARRVAHVHAHTRVLHNNSKDTEEEASKDTEEEATTDRKIDVRVQQQQQQQQPQHKQPPQPAGATTTKTITHEGRR